MSIQNNITPIEPKNSSSPHGGGGFRWGGKKSRMSTPILPFPHHKGEGDEIRNSQVKYTKPLLNNIAIREVTFFFPQLGYYQR
jgi:hypothetical protein